MPLWRIFSHPSTFSTEQRRGLAADITKFYSSRGLPPFYVNVIFIDVTENQVWVGGEPKSNFVRIVIEQIARTLPNPETEEGKKYRLRFMDLLNEVRN
jgi:phenylpyruvate tautomerase PptA (4-oxalocrotonate tautomerase family)